MISIYGAITYPLPELTTSMPTNDPFNITGVTTGAVKDPTLANRSSASVSNTVSYRPVLTLGSAS